MRKNSGEIMGKQIIVVGGGASGMTAAIAAANTGAKVHILEQMNRVGKKILATGNGRCNFSNLHICNEYYQSQYPDFVASVISSYSTDVILDFFKSLGIWPRVRDGCIYPNSMESGAVVSAFEASLRTKKISVSLDTKVLSITSKKHQWQVTTSKGDFYGDAVIIATGGKASPKLGSDGTGYDLAKALGHHVITPKPALTGLKCSGRFFKSISGVRTKAKVTLLDITEGSPVILDQDIGELQLTDYGISGIPVFQISGQAAIALEAHKQICVEIDFLPDVFTSKDEFIKHIQSLPEKTASESMTGLLHTKLIPLLLRAAAIDMDCLVKDIPVSKLETLYDRCGHFKVQVTGTGDFSNAQVCIGGVDTKEIFPETMMSKLVPNIYFTGELLDVTGKCGGLNLHFAWATGLIAGKCAGSKA